MPNTTKSKSLISFRYFDVCTLADKNEAWELIKMHKNFFMKLGTREQFGDLNYFRNKGFALGYIGLFCISSPKSKMIIQKSFYYVLIVKDYHDIQHHKLLRWILMVNSVTLWEGLKFICCIWEDAEFFVKHFYISWTHDLIYNHYLRPDLSIMLLSTRGKHLLSGLLLSKGFSINELQKWVPR